MKIANSVNRLGTEAVYNIFAKTKKLIGEGKEIIDLSLGQSDFKSPQHAVNAAIKALKDGHHGYTLPNGIIECRQSVSRKIRSLYKANIEPGRIVIMPGGKPTMHYAISFFGELLNAIHFLTAIDVSSNDHDAGPVFRIHLCNGLH